MQRGIMGILLVLVAGPVAAQQGPPGREALRQAVLERFMQNFIQQAGLSDDQRVEFRQTLQRNFREDQQLTQRRNRLLRSIEDQMRPGVAADPDSVTSLLETLVSLGEETAATARARQEEYAGFLSPVQRALLVVHFERFQRQIEGVQRRQQMQRRGNMPEGNSL
jgi:transposase